MKKLLTLFLCFALVFGAVGSVNAKADDRDP